MRLVNLPVCRTRRILAKIKFYKCSFTEFDTCQRMAIANAAFFTLTYIFKEKHSKFVYFVNGELAQNA